ncbi:MAG: hypothetical protein Aurels2KO_50760 [Aureliella sp.]
MPRKSEPYYRKAQKRWVATIDGRRVTLGENKKEAFEKFYKLMGNKASVQLEVNTLYELSQSYLDWVETNRASSTYDKHRFYLESFIGHVGKSTRIASLKPHHITKWTNKPSWGDTSRHDAITVVQRMLNWAVDEGYLPNSPIGKIKKPRQKTREIVYTPDQWQKIRGHTSDCFADLLDFLWLTGCRPQEARSIEARHINEDLVIFPPDESKGETNSRVIFLPPQARTIIDRLKLEHPNGTLFRNSRGRAWTKDSVKCRLTRISKLVGFRIIAYGARHSYATNALVNSVDPISLAHLMGHRDTSMISKVYSHVAKNVEFLRMQAVAAAGETYP